MIWLGSQVIQNLLPVNVIHDQVYFVLDRIEKVLNSLDNIFMIESFYNLSFFKLRLSLLLVILTTDFDRVKMATRVILPLTNIHSGTAAFAQLLPEGVLRIEAISCLALSIFFQLLSLPVQKIQICTGIPHA